jgi:hypothetical protein
MSLNLAMRDPFGRLTPMIGDFQFLWVGWAWWWPLIGFCRVSPENPMASVWRWQFFLGPLEVRRWVPAAGEGRP